MYNYYWMGRSRVSSYLLISFWTTEQKQIGSIKSSLLNRIGDVFLCLHSIILGIVKSFDFGIILCYFQNNRKSI